MTQKLETQVQWLLFVAFFELVFVSSDTVQEDCQWNEFVVECGRCEATCEHTEPDPLCCKSCKPRRCECVRSKGFVRAKDGACIPLVDCHKYNVQYISPGHDPRISPNSLLGKLMGELRRELIEEYETGRSVNHRRKMIEHMGFEDLSEKKNFSESDKLLYGVPLNDEEGRNEKEKTEYGPILYSNAVGDNKGNKITFNVSKEGGLKASTLNSSFDTGLPERSVKSTLHSKAVQEDKKEAWKNSSIQLTEFSLSTRARFIAGADSKFEVRCLPHCCEPPCGSCKPPCGQNCPPPCN
uniref:BOWMAN_BIRK domain-containing protein n=1 Tax=Syphacia muris TaxID=451379 RepID=A0A0N5AMV7_9BILA